MPTREEEIKEIQRLREIEEIKALRERPEAPKDKSIGEAIKGAGKYAAETVAGLAAGAEQALPFSGALDKVGGATYAAQQSLFDLFRDKKNQKSFGEHFQTGVDAIQKPRQEAMDKAPIASTVGQAAGAIGGGLAVPIPGAGLKGVGGAAARIAGVAGMGALERGTSGEGVFDVEAAKQAATVGSGIQAGIESLPVVGKVAGLVKEPATKLATKAGEYLQEIAATRAIKAAIGNNQKIYRDLGGTPERLGKLGEQALEEGVVSFGNKAGKIAEKAKGVSKEAWSKVEQVFAQADEAGVKVDPRNIVDEILVKAQTIEPVGSGRKVVNQLLREAEDS
jgi:hypothetical protein